MEYFLTNKRYVRHPDIVLVEIKSLAELRDAAFNTFLGNTKEPNWAWVRNESFKGPKAEKYYYSSVHDHDIFVAFTVANKFIITVSNIEWMKRWNLRKPKTKILDIDGNDVTPEIKGPQGDRATYYHLRDLVLEFRKKYPPEIKNIKVSFDFDGVLDEKPVQEFVKKLDERVEVHVVTARDFKNSNYEKDTYQLTDSLGIPRSNVHSTMGSPKYLFFQKNPDFVFHLDNDPTEITDIIRYTKIKGILYDTGWEKNCLKAIE
jgi:hypothetical protein